MSPVRRAAGWCHCAGSTGIELVVALPLTCCMQDRRRVLQATLGGVAAAWLPGSASAVDAGSAADPFEGDPFKSFQWPELEKRVSGCSRPHPV